jgi:hypothetical protein
MLVTTLVPDLDFIFGWPAEAARLFFPRLKDGSTVINDTEAETFIYVLNPEEFNVCLSWKNDKIDSLWNFTPAVE